MCGRYTLTNTDQLRLRFDVDAADIPIPADPNIAPSRELPVILQVDGERRLELMRWGLIPRWSKGADRERYATINARADTVATKPSYRAPFRRQRCLVPADGFFEWRRED